MEKIILVDENDNEIGSEEKIKIHEKGKLHRAFSILVFNSKGELLIQKRAKNKYHCGGLWTNTVCSHPKPNETLDKAAHERLIEEMGFDCHLEEIFKFHYKIKFNNGLIENEIDHVFIGEFDENPKPNPTEVEEYQWVSIKDLKEDIEKNSAKYTYWFKIALEKYLKIRNKTNILEKNRIYTELLKLKTNNELEFINITKDLQKIIKKSEIKNGFINVFSKHTTLALKISEDEVLLLKDIEWLMKKLIPDEREYLHDDTKLRKNCPLDEPKNGKGHLRNLLLETSQTIPILNNEMVLGTWQQVFAVETSGPRNREIIVQVIGQGAK